MIVENLRCGSTLTTFPDRCEALRKKADDLRSRCLALGAMGDDDLFQRACDCVREAMEIVGLEAGDVRFQAFQDLDLAIKGLGREVLRDEARVAKAKAQQDRDAEAVFERHLRLPAGTLRTRAPVLRTRASAA